MKFVLPLSACIALFCSACGLIGSPEIETDKEESVVVINTGTNSGTGVAPSSSLTADTFAVQIVSAMCHRLVDCRPPYGLEVSEWEYDRWEDDPYQHSYLTADFFEVLGQFETVGDCLEAAPELARTPLFPAHFELQAHAEGRREFVGAVGEDCISAVQTGACFDAQPTTVACSQAFVASVNLRGSCLASTDCVEGLVCLNNYSCGGGECRPPSDQDLLCGDEFCDSGFCDRNYECAPRLSAGIPCDPYMPDDGCVDGLVCREDEEREYEATCMRPRQIGEQCFFSGACGDGAFCNNDYVCERTRGPGRDCEEDDECSDGLVCDWGRCGTRDSEEYGCDYNEDCPVGHGCRYDEYYEAYVCRGSGQATEAATEEGEECSSSADCDPLAGLVCNRNRGAAAGICRKVGSLEAGQACSTSAACANGLTCDGTCVEVEVAQLGDDCVSRSVRCDMGLYCDLAANECRPLGEELDSCARDTHCKPNLFCNERTYTCEPRGEQGDACDRPGHCNLLSCFAGQCELQIDEVCR